MGIKYAHYIERKINRSNRAASNIYKISKKYGTQKREGRTESFITLHERHKLRPKKFADCEI